MATVVLFWSLLLLNRKYNNHFALLLLVFFEGNVYSVLAVLARQFSLRVVELCSRAVTENYCVIGQLEVGVVNVLPAGAECAKCLAFRVRVLLWAGPLRTSQVFCN